MWAFRRPAKGAVSTKSIEGRQSRIKIYSYLLTRLPKAGPVDKRFSPRRRVGIPGNLQWGCAVRLSKSWHYFRQETTHSLLFQTNAYKANVREFPPRGFSPSKKWTVSIIKVTIKHVKQQQPLNEDVFEASVLRFFIFSFKRCDNEYLLGSFFTFLLKFNLFLGFFFLSKTWLQISMCV